MLNMRQQYLRPRPLPRIL